MPEANFRSILESWKGGEVTVVNPQSFRRGAITNAIDLETFPAKLLHVGSDFVEVNYEAKKKGQVRAVGVSCHDYGAMETAAEHPWVDVHLARINHRGGREFKMDGTTEEVVRVLRRTKAT